MLYHFQKHQRETALSPFRSVRETNIRLSQQCDWSSVRPDLPQSAFQLLSLVLEFVDHIGEFWVVLRTWADVRIPYTKDYKAKMIPHLR